MEKQNFKKIIIFDLDGTLAESKSPIDEEMSCLLKVLIKVKKVAVISGGDWPQFQKQVVSQLPSVTHFQNLFILPTCGTKWYDYQNDWNMRYEDRFKAEEKTKIFQALHQALSESQLNIPKTWGDQIEDRESQITFSALGQNAPLSEKEKWDPDFEKRKKIKEILDNLIPDFSVRLGGTTSIDITRPGIDKAYGIGKIQEILNIPISEMVFVGDALFPGGNDYPARQAGVVSIRVNNPSDTKRVIETMIACLSEEKPPIFDKNETS